MDYMWNRIVKLAEDESENIITFLRDIIAIPSFSGKEGQVIGRIREEIENIGFDEIYTDPFGNLLGRIGSGKRILAFDGHCDTVCGKNPEKNRIS